MDTELKDKVAALRSYVEETEGMGLDQRDQILEAVSELEKKIRESEGEPAPHHGLIESLEESVLNLEASHPKATSLLQQISEALSRMGI